jgi:hypothetical protein
VYRRVHNLFSARGPGFRRLAESSAASVAGDTLVTIGLAGTLFFQVPSTDARQNVALYLLLTLAPFAVVGPLLGGLYTRFPAAYRGGLVVGAGARAIIALAMVAVGVDTVWLFPLAFLLLVFSRLHGISRNSLLPVVVDQPVELVSANARMARIGVLTGSLVAPIGAGLAALTDAAAALLLAVVFFVASTFASLYVPMARRVILEPVGRDQPGSAAERRRRLPQSVRLTRLATAGVRFLNGFLLLLVAFAFRDQDASVFSFGFLLGMAGAGFFLASFTSPWLERKLREEPMVVAALALEAGAAFLAAQVVGDESNAVVLAAAGFLAAAAGFSWGTAKFGFDGLLQANVEPRHRAAAFTYSETIFQLVWVVGALIPTVASGLPIEVGLVAAGMIALAIQVVYISGLLLPYTQRRRETTAPEAEEPEAPEDHGEPRRRDVTEFF